MANTFHFVVIPRRFNLYFFFTFSRMADTFHFHFFTNIFHFLFFITLSLFQDGWYNDLCQLSGVDYRQGHEGKGPGEFNVNFFLQVCKKLNETTEQKDTRHKTLVSKEEKVWKKPWMQNARWFQCQFLALQIHKERKASLCLPCWNFCRWYNWK